MQDGQFHIDQEDPKPKFDPKKPFKPVDANGTKPAFDPNKSYESVKKKESPLPDFGKTVGGSVPTSSPTSVEPSEGSDFNVGVFQEFTSGASPKEKIKETSDFWKTISTTASPVQNISDFNTQFEARTGRQPELDLGSDLPQIKKTSEEEKYAKYREAEERIAGALSSIQGLDGSMKDISVLRKEAPAVLRQIKAAVGAEATVEDVQKKEGQEEWQYQSDKGEAEWRHDRDVFAAYEKYATEEKLQFARRRRESVEANLKTTLPFASTSYPSSFIS